MSSRFSPIVLYFSLIPITMLILLEQCSDFFFVNSLGAHSFAQRRARTSGVPCTLGTASTLNTRLPSKKISFLSSSVATQLSGSKWDNLVDEDDDDEFEPQGPGIAKDMRYLEFNIMRQNKHFVAIRDAGGAEMTNDIYVRNPDSDTFWFCGKVARISDVSLAQAIARQWALIEEHAARLRSMELYPKRGMLEIWTAPGDSEMDVAYNRPDTKFIKMKKSDEVDGADEVKNLAIGFQGEIYDSDEEGFRTWRTEDGLPLKPEIKGPEEEKRPPTDEEMAKINELLKDKDLNSLFDNE